jgi:hypothetical protein
MRVQMPGISRVPAPKLVMQANETATEQQMPDYFRYRLLMVVHLLGNLLSQIRLARNPAPCGRLRGILPDVNLAARACAAGLADRKWLSVCANPALDWDELHLWSGCHATLIIQQIKR